jgi:hypothetical protein
LLLDQERYAQIQKYNDARETEQKRKDLYVTEIKQQIKKNETDKKNLEIARIAEVRIMVLYRMFITYIYSFRMHKFAWKGHKKHKMMN